MWLCWQESLIAGSSQLVTREFSHKFRETLDYLPSLSPSWFVIHRVRTPLSRLLDRS